jgi:hypothetical protein
MFASVGASVGTSSYIISKSGVDRLLAYHDANGYQEAIPNVMAKLYSSSRYAAYPMIFHRAGMQPYIPCTLTFTLDYIF